MERIEDKIALFESEANDYSKHAAAWNSCSQTARNNDEAANCERKHDSFITKKQTLLWVVEHMRDLLPPPPTK